MLLLFALVPELCLSQSVSDCNGAVQLCGDIYTESFATSSTGNIYEPTGACNNGLEVSSLWYTFTVVQTGSMGFVLTPSNFNDDYDWGLFNITQNGCAGIVSGLSPEVSCNSYGLFTNSGPTGISSSNGGSGNTNGPGDLNGPPFNGDLSVVAGETYALVVMNWSNSTGGYTIDFSNSSASLYDNEPPTVLSVTSDCTQPGIEVVFSENLVTTSIQPGDFILTGPNGNVTIVSVTLANPNSPGNPAVTLIPASGILPPGNYTLNLPDVAGFVNDPCGNTASGTFDFTIDSSLVTVNAGADITLCPGETVVLEATGNYSSVQWVNGPNTAQFTISNAGNYQVTAELNGCFTSDVVNVSIQTLPNWTLGNDTTVCSIPAFSLVTEVPVTWENGVVSNSYLVNSTETISATYNYLGCDITDSISIVVSTPPDLNLGNDTTLCGGEVLSFSFPTAITWNGTTNSASYTVSEPQIVVASFSNGVCSAIDSLEVNYVPPLSIPILDQYTYCSGDTITLSAISESVETIIWFDGTTSPTHDFFETGAFNVTVSNYCETLSKTWSMEFIDCDSYIYVPNCFTPNSDGINDVWFPSLNNAKEFEVSIYSRWGDLIYYSRAYSPWIGNVHGGDYFASDGVYTYSIKVKFNNGQAKELVGHVVLTR
ncbi:MAG: gliding motility-associated C-terminal domain-containing protein [Bacteroidota bacterium]